METFACKRCGEEKPLNTMMHNWRNVCRSCFNKHSLEHYYRVKRTQLYGEGVEERRRLSRERRDARLAKRSREDKCSQCGCVFRARNLTRFRKGLWCRDCLCPDYEPKGPEVLKTNYQEPDMPQIDAGDWIVIKVGVEKFIKKNNIHYDNIQQSNERLVWHAIAGRIDKGLEKAGERDSSLRIKK